MTVERKLTCFQIVLSLQNPKNTKVAGYQAPIPLSEVTAEQGPDDLDQVNNQRRQRKEKKDDETADKPKVQKPAQKEAQEETKDGQAPKRRRPKRRPKTARPEGAEGQKIDQ